MSNKTQLQTSNTKIDELNSLVEVMRGKVANLPDAGSSSTGNANAGEWIQVMSLPATYATPVEPGEGETWSTFFYEVEEKCKIIIFAFVYSEGRAYASVISSKVEGAFNAISINDMSGLTNVCEVETVDTNVIQIRLMPERCSDLYMLPVYIGSIG